MADKVATLVAEISADTSKLDNGLKEAKGGLEGVVGSFTELSSVIGLAEKGFGMVKGAIDQTVGATVSYAAEVRSLSQAFSITTEESSRLLQLADDLNVSSGTLTTAFREMAKNGLTPSAAALKKLAEQYHDIQDPAERAQFALKNFGRAGLEMSPVLRLTSQEIDEMGQSAQSAGLIMSGEAVQAARDYEVQIDNLGDTVEGLKVKIGSGLLPVLNEWLGTINADMARQERLRAAWKAGAITLDEYRIANSLVQSTQSEFADQVAATNAKVDAYNRSQEKLTMTTGATIDAVIALGKANRDNASATNDAASATEDYSQRLGDIQALLAGDLGKENDDYYQSQKDLGAQISEVTGKLQDLQAIQGQQVTITHEATGTADELFIAQDKLLSTSYALGKAQQDLNNATDPDKQHILAVEVAKLKGEYEQAAGKVNELGGSTETFTANNKTQIDELTAKQAELQEAYKRNAEEHDLATKKIIFNILEQRLAADGWQEHEVELLAKVGEKWGIFDHDTASALRSVNQSLKDFNQGNVNDTVVILSNIFGYPTEKTYKIRVDYQGPQAGEVGIGPTSTGVPAGPETEIGGRRAGGGPVMAGEDYLVGERGPEIFRAPKNGVIIPNGQTSMGGLFAGATIVLQDPINVEMLAETVTRKQRENSR